MNELSHLYDFLTPALIGIVAYFLRGLLNTIKRLEEDFGKFREEYAGHRAESKENRERIEALQERAEQNERDINSIRIELAKITK